MGRWDVGGCATKKQGCDVKADKDSSSLSLGCHRGVFLSICAAPSCKDPPHSYGECRSFTSSLVLPSRNVVVRLQEGDLLTSCMLFCLRKKKKKLFLTFSFRSFISSPKYEIY